MSNCSWLETRIEGFEHFTSEIRKLNAHWPNRRRGLFRGHAKASWPLEPTLTRLLKGKPPTNVAQLEDEMRHSFRNECGRFISDHYIPHPKDLLGWWALMRHYGAPTRVLDWTLSAYVALYFAVIEEWASDGMVWFVRMHDYYGTLSEDEGSFIQSVSNIATHENLRSSDTPPVLAFFESTRQMDRLAAQQGWFSVCFQPNVDHGTILLSSVRGRESVEHLRRFLIPAAMKPEFMRELQMMNITAKSLFPGVDGLGRSMEEIARLSIKFGRPPPISELRLLDPNK